MTIQIQHGPQYLVTVKHNSDSDIQPDVPSLRHRWLTEVQGIDTNRVCVTLCDGAPMCEFESLMDADDAVIEYETIRNFR